MRDKIRELVIEAITDTNKLTSVVDELCDLHNVIVPEGTVCDCWEDNWSYKRNGIDRFCTKCGHQENQAVL